MDNIVDYVVYDSEELTNSPMIVNLRGHMLQSQYIISVVLIYGNLTANSG